jgi:predicted dehydrogenase
LNIGIIGAGGIAHKLHLPQLVEISDINVTHVAGREEWRLKILCEKFDIPHYTLNYDDLVAEDSLDAIVVATPHPQHVPFGLAVLNAGKHLLIQKPLCGKMEEADAFVEAVNKTNKTVMALPHFGAETYKMREMVDAGDIGKVSGAGCRTSHGGPEVYYAEIRDAFNEQGNDLWFFRASDASVGALFDMGVYAVANLVAVLGSVQSVMGQVATIDKPTTLEDTATLILHFASGAVACMETGWCDPARTFQMRVHGTKGKIVTPGEGASMTLWEPTSYTREDAPPKATPIEVEAASRGTAHQHWIECIREGRHPERSHAWAARHVTEVLLAGLESSRTGQRITIRSKAERE